MNFEVIFIVLGLSFFFIFVFGLKIYYYISNKDKKRKEEKIEKKYPLYAVKKKFCQELKNQNQLLYINKISPLYRTIDKFILEKDLLPDEILKEKEKEIEKIKVQRYKLLSQHINTQKDIDCLQSEIFNMRKEILEKGK